MASRKVSNGSNKRAIEQYDHKDKQRLNNPPVGLVTPETDTDKEKKKYVYDPHLDPALQWAGKAERSSFEVPTVSLHVHERIDSRSILEAVRKKNGNNFEQMSLFNSAEEKPPLREAVDFYKHPHNWSNRLIAGDSLLVMNSLVEKEGMAGKVQMVFFDPPYGIRYGSNFQPFVNKRDVKDGKDEDLTQEPEMIRAFRDTWELGIHSYLTYIRDRLLMTKEILNETGSVFVQISDENVHLIKNLMDEIFGANNFISLITFAKTSSQTAQLLPGVSDYLVWYAKDKSKVKYRQLYKDKEAGGVGGGAYTRVELPSGERRTLSKEEKNDLSILPQGSKIYRVDNLTSQGFRQNTTVDFEFKGKKYHPGHNSNWKCTVEGLKNLAKANRIEASSNQISYVRFIDDFPVFGLTSTWMDTGVSGSALEKRYVVETNPKVIERCILMTTDPGDLVFDPTCGSGTTAYASEKWGRRWITCDTSKVAITLAKQRLVTMVFDFYELAHFQEGIASGFQYETVPHITLKSIAYGDDLPPKN